MAAVDGKAKADRLMQKMESVGIEPLKPVLPDERWIQSIRELGFTKEQLDLIRMKCMPRDTPMHEAYLFLLKAKAKGLDPLSGEVWLTRQYSDGPSGPSSIRYVIGIGISGCRLLASRTDRYRPSSKPTLYETKPDGSILSATVYIDVYDNHSQQWSEVAGTAYFDEYAVYVFKAGEIKLAPHWERMPRNMIEKCAEAKAIRRAFPTEFSGIYTAEEMEQETSATKDAVGAVGVAKSITNRVERDLERKLQ